jgi:hypothetical protein
MEKWNNRASANNKAGSNEFTAHSSLVCSQKTGRKGVMQLEEAY